MASGIMKTCEGCGRTKDEDNFYQYKDGSKMELCKQCFTMRMDAFDPSTFLWALEKCDIPYVEEEWNVLRDRAWAKDPKKFSHMAVFGKYLSKMKLKQWKDKTWADTEKIAAENAERKAKLKEKAKTRDEELKAAYEAGQISKAEYETFVNTEVLYNESPQSIDPVKGPNGFNAFDETQFISEEDLPDPAAELTQEDKVYLAMKWGRNYRPSEWLSLEKDYTEMKKSFDIQDADSEKSLMFLCKANLKADQAIDCGDIDGFQKLMRAQEALRKSAKFTAAQNKEEKADFVDCIGTMVAYCEKVGGVIPRLKLDYDYDIVDKVINDMKGYTKSLIYEDTSLSRQIEDYLRNRENADAKKRDEAEAKAKGLDVVEIEDEDHVEYSEYQEKLKEMDEMFYANIGDEEEK